MIVFRVTLLPASTASRGNRVLKTSSTWSSYQGSKEEWGAPSSSSPSSSCHKAQVSLSTTSCHCWSMSLHLSLLLHSPLLLSRDICVLHVSSPHKPQVLSRSGLGEAVPQAGQEPDLVDCELNQSESLWGIAEVPGQITARESACQKRRCREGSQVATGRDSFAEQAHTPVSVLTQCPSTETHIGLQPCLLVVTHKAANLITMVS